MAAAPALILNPIRQLVTVDTGHTTEENPLGVIENATMVLQDGKIQWLGSSAELSLAAYPDAIVIDASDKIVMPGLIDSHTHPIFAGDRAK